MSAYEVDYFKQAACPGFHGVHGICGPAAWVNVCELFIEKAVKPAKIVRARIEERSNAFMGWSPKLSFGGGSLPTTAGGGRVRRTKYTKVTKVFKCFFFCSGFRKLAPEVQGGAAMISPAVVQYKTGINSQ